MIPTPWVYGGRFMPPSSFTLLIFHSEEACRLRRQTSTRAARPIDRHSIINQRVSIDRLATMSKTLSTRLRATLLRGIDFSTRFAPSSYDVLQPRLFISKEFLNFPENTYEFSHVKSMQKYPLIMVLL